MARCKAAVVAAVVPAFFECALEKPPLVCLPGLRRQRLLRLVFLDAKTCQQGIKWGDVWQVGALLARVNSFWWAFRANNWAFILGIWVPLHFFYFIFCHTVCVCFPCKISAPFTTAPCACVTNQSTLWLREECSPVFLVSAEAIMPEAKDEGNIHPLLTCVCKVLKHFMVCVDFLMFGRGDKSILHLLKVWISAQKINKCRFWNILK